MDQEALPPTDRRGLRPATDTRAKPGSNRSRSRCCALVLNLAGNGRTGLWDRDEPRYAVCVREMRARGDWIFPTFNGEPRYQKPILIYWLMGLATAVGGRQPVRRTAGLGAGRGRRRCWASGGWAGGCSGPRGGTAGRADLGDGADHGRRVEARDDRRDTGALAPRLPVLPLGVWTAAVPAGRRAVLGLARLATLTKGAGRAGLDRGCRRSGLVVGLAVPPGDGSTGDGAAGLLVLLSPWFVAIAIASQGEFFRFAVGKQIVYRVASGHGEPTAGSPAITRSSRCWCSIPGRPCSPRPGRGLGSPQVRPDSGLPAGLDRSARSSSWSASGPS